MPYHNRWYMPEEVKIFLYIKYCTIASLEKYLPQGRKKEQKTKIKLYKRFNVFGS